MEDFFGYNVLYVMNITDIDDKIIVAARKDHLFKEFQAKSNVCNQALIGECQLALNYYIEKNLGKYDANVLTAWEAFLKKANAGEIVASTEDLKFKLYLVTAENARVMIEKAKTGKPEMALFWNATRDVLALWLDHNLGNGVSDPKIFRDFAAFWEDEFFKDIDLLNVFCFNQVRRPDVLTRVSEYVPEIVTYVEKIMANGYAYELEGSIYFNTVKFNTSEGHAYAKLCPWSASDVKLMAEGEGELTANVSQKRNIADFALWKASKQGEPSWVSPWGNGRPGWHIECSVMASAVLGDNMDIHSGGVDLAFPHHDNELAQAEAHYDCKQWVNYFLHTGHLHIEGMKMSKSLKNFLSIREGLETATASQMRIMFLVHQWDATMDFSAGSISSARSIEASIENFLNTVRALVQEQRFESQQSNGAHNFAQPEATLLNHLRVTQEQVHEALADSFNTPRAINQIRLLISQGNQYYQDTTKSKSKPNALVLSRVGSYVTKILRIFGVFRDENPALGTFAASCKETNQEQLLPIVHALSTFRDGVRGLAQQKADPRLILEVCDKLRDMDLVELGVSLEDREDGKALVKLMDKEILIAQRQEKIDKENEKLKQKEVRKLAEAQKKLDRLAKGAMVPFEMFRNAEFIEWDPTGIPTKDKEGVEIGKNRRKKLEKEFAQQQKLHLEFLTHNEEQNE